MTILRNVYSPCILHHDWQPTSVNLENANIRHQVCALSAENPKQGVSGDLHQWEPP